MLLAESRAVALFFGTEVAADPEVEEEDVASFHSSDRAACAKAFQDEQLLNRPQWLGVSDANCTFRSDAFFSALTAGKEDAASGAKDSGQHSPTLDRCSRSGRCGRMSYAC